MQKFLDNARGVGLIAGVLLVLASALPWVTVSMPFLGSITVYGLKTGGDGWVALGFGVAVIAGTFLRKPKRLALGIVGVIATVGYVGEFVYSRIALASAQGDLGMFAGTVSINPAIGLVLGTLVGLALAFWGLVLPRLGSGRVEPVAA